MCVFVVDVNSEHVVFEFEYEYSNFCFLAVLYKCCRMFLYHIAVDCILL